MERTAFIERVRRRLGGVAGPALPASLPASPATGDGRPPVDRFVQELEKVGGGAKQIGMDALGEAVRRIAAELGVRRSVVAPDVGPLRDLVEEGLRRAGVEVLRPVGTGWRDAAEVADLGITSAVLGVAATGSVLIETGARSPRVASLLPGAHLVILPAERLVPGLEEALERLPGLVERSSGVVMVTGPSRTADIEMQIVHGVHGPRVLRVLLVR